jgi:hypothetical protein
LGSLQRSQHTTVGGIGLERWLRKRALLLPEEVSDQVGEKCGLDPARRDRIVRPMIAVAFATPEPASRRLVI